MHVLRLKSEGQLIDIERERATVKITCSIVLFFVDLIKYKITYRRVTNIYLYILLKRLNFVLFFEIGKIDFNW